MYKGDYDQEAIFLNKELDRKRIENEKCEAILYQADYEVLNSWNKDIRETRVVKFIHDNGTVYHGVYRGIDVDKNAPNELDSIYNTLSTDEFFASGDFWCAETDIPEELGDTPCEIWLGNRDIDGNIDWNNSVCLNEKAIKEWAANYDKLDKEVKVKFYADIKREDIKEVEQSLKKSGADIIADNFPELKYISHFNIEILGNAKSNDKKEIKVSFYAEMEEKDFESVEHGFQKSGADIIADNFPELSNIGYFKIFESSKLKLEENNAINDAIERRFKEEQEYDKFFNQYDDREEHIDNESNEGKKTESERFLTSPPPPVIDGVAIRIDGLNDVTEREAKKYIDLVVEKIQENARKNLSSISITKQEDGHIKLDYVLHNEKFERIRRITGYLVGSMDKWNNAKRAEEAERVKHVEKKTFEQGFSELCKEHNVSPKKAIKAMVNKMVDEKNKQNGSQR